MAKNASQTEKGQNLKDTPKQEKGVSSAAHAAAVAAAKKERPLPDPCGKSELGKINIALHNFCLLYTSPSPRDVEESRMPSSA